MSGPGPGAILLAVAAHFPCCRPRTLGADFGGLFLFAADLARMGIDDLLQDMPGTARIPAGCAVRSLLALKLWGIGRPSQVMAETLDEGLALFAGLNAIPKRSTLSEYTARCDPHFTGGLLHRWYHAAQILGLGLGDGRSFDLDFHTIPYHGDQALLEKHFVSKRSSRQRGILTFLARDAQARIFSYANSTLRKKRTERCHYALCCVFRRCGTPGKIDLEHLSNRSGMPVRLNGNTGTTEVEQLNGVKVACIIPLKC